MIVRAQLAALLVLAAALGPAGAQGRPIKISIAAKAPLYAPYFIAQDKGYYAAEGLEPQFIEAPGGVATPALIAGSIDVSTSSASALSAILRGAKLKLVYTMANRLPDQLWTSHPEAKSLKDMKGLAVGIASRGDSYEIALRSMLEIDRLPQDWIAYTPLGFNAQVRLAALLKGALPAVMITPIDLAPAKADGSLAKCCHLVIDFVKTLRLPYTGAAVSDRLLKSDSKLVEGFLRATIKGVRYALAFEPQTVAILKKRNPQEDEKIILETYRETVPTMTKVGTASDALIERDLRVRAAFLKTDVNKLPKIGDIYDYRLTRKVTAELDKSGWQPKP